jgi:hypothetical protein
MGASAAAFQLLEGFFKILPASAAELLLRPKHSPQVLEVLKEFPGPHDGERRTRRDVLPAQECAFFPHESPPKEVTHAERGVHYRPNTASTRPRAVALSFRTGRPR